jgi:hypothetical protein
LKAADDALAVLHDKVYAEPRRLAVAMAAHDRLGAKSLLWEIVAHHDVVMMLLMDGFGMDAEELLV